MFKMLDIEGHKKLKYPLSLKAHTHTPAKIHARTHDFLYFQIYLHIYLVTIYYI